MVDPAGSGPAYRGAPVAVAAALAVCVLMTPVSARETGWVTGGDALVLVGLLALARIAIAMSAWDVGGGFGLMGAARDLTFAILGEALILLVVLLAAAPAGGTELGRMWSAASGTGVWGEPAHWCGLVAMALVVLLETGRQPIDNPDTHLELTMIHEGPLLEYAGRDLAYLQWTTAARHWLVLVLAAQVFLPHPHGVWLQLAVLPLTLLALCAALALVETLVAKMRILLVPRLLAAGMIAGLLGIASWLVSAT
jgi:formate hydrogenlyase subunit 4